MNINRNKLEQAYLYYNHVREGDAQLYELQDSFCNFIARRIGAIPVNNGSFALLLNLASSDLDFVVGLPTGEHSNAHKSLLDIGRFVGTQPNTINTSRHVYKVRKDDIEFDLEIVQPGDLELTVQGIENCRAGMTHDDRVLHVWIKKQLLDQGLHAEYYRHKREPYRRYFDPRFVFSQDHKVFATTPSPSGV